MTAPASAIKPVWLICQFELIRLFLTKRGMILLAAFAMIWGLILYYPVFEAVKILNNEFFTENITVFSSTLNLQHLMTWPYPELAVYWLLAVFTFPVITIIMTSDQTASDSERGTMRFLLLRCTRNQLLFGRFFGQLFIICFLIATTMLAAILMGVSRDFAALASTFDEVALVFSNLVLACLPFIALMALFNALFKSSKLSIVATIIAIPIIKALLQFAAYYVPVLGELAIVLPGLQLTELAQISSLNLGVLQITALLQTAAYLILAQVVLTRRAL